MRYSGTRHCELDVRRERRLCSGTPGVESGEPGLSESGGEHDESGGVSFRAGLFEGLEGLLHVSEIADRHVKDPADELKVGDTVDVKNANWTNTIGDTELIKVWKDPDFDPKQRAFYYLRVLEIPTPRWTAHDAKYYGTKPLKGTPMMVTERAYTSPIWYAPE